MVVLITRHLPRETDERKRILDRFTARFRDLIVVSDEDLRAPAPANELCDLLLGLVCGSTPSCLDAVIPRHFLDNYDRLNELYADLIHSRLAENAAAQLAPTEGSETYLILNHHFFLLPEKIRRRDPAAHIVYCVGNMFPVSELFTIVPFASTLLRGLLGADKLQFASLRAQNSFINSVVWHLAITPEKNLIQRCALTGGRKIELSLNTYRPAAVGDGSSSAFYRSADRVVLVSIESALSNTHSMTLRLNAMVEMLQSQLIDEARVVLTGEQTYGSDFPLALLGPEDQRVLDLVMLVAKLNYQIDRSGARAPLILIYRQTEAECAEQLADAAILVIGEPYAVGCRYLRQYLASRCGEGDEAGVSSKSAVARIVVSESSEVAGLARSSGWPLFKPFSQEDMVAKVSAVLQLDSGPNIRCRRTMRQLDKYQNEHWLDNLASFCQQNRQRRDSQTRFKGYALEGLLEAFLFRKTGKHKIVISEVEGVLAPMEMTVANRCLLPPVVLQWGGLAQRHWAEMGAGGSVEDVWIDLYLSSRLSPEALTDVMGVENITVDAENGHFHKAVGHSDFVWSAEGVELGEAAQLLREQLGELLTYYQERTPGSYVITTATTTSFHVQDSVKKSNRAALYDLTAHIQSGVLPNVRSLELAVFPRSVLITANAKQRLTTLVDGVSELKTNRAHQKGRRDLFGDTDILGIGCPSFLDQLALSYPDAITISTAAAPADGPYDYAFGSPAEVISLLQELQIANKMGSHLYLTTATRTREQSRPPAASPHIGSGLRRNRVHPTGQFTISAVGCFEDSDSSGSADFASADGD